MQVTVTITMDEGEAPDLLTKLTALFKPEAVDFNSASVPPVSDVAEPPAKRRPRASKPATSDTPVEPPAPVAPPPATVVAVPDETTVSAFDAIMQAQNPTPKAADAPELTPDEYRNGIRNLTIEHLGYEWAKEHLLPLGGLKDMPEDQLPRLWVKAQADALAVTARAAVAA